MNDLINRQAAIDEISKYASIWVEYDVGMTQEEVVEAALKAAKRTMGHIIEEMPSAQPEQRWIPVSDSKSLPEDEWVLISKKPTKLSGSKWCVNIAIRMANPRSGKIQWRDTGFGIIPDDKVLAWMPRPKPYREEGEQDAID